MIDLVSTSLAGIGVVFVGVLLKNIQKLPKEFVSKEIFINHREENQEDKKEFRENIKELNRTLNRHFELIVLEIKKNGKKN